MEEKVEPTTKQGYRKDKTLYRCNERKKMSQVELSLMVMALEETHLAEA